jgi:hypothetical protein
MSRCLDNIICEARCCAATLGAQYAKAFKYGEVTDTHLWNFRKLHSFIQTLDRNHVTVKHKKELKAVSSVNFSALEKQNSFLSLKHTHRVVCVKEEIGPCLSDSEIDHIVEQIRLLCSSCNCNCN